MAARIPEDNDGQAFLDTLGASIDEAIDRSDESALKALLLRCDEGEKRLTESRQPVLSYFRANAHAAIYRLKSSHLGWTWSDPDREAEIFHLRKASRHPAFRAQHLIRQCQVLTNLGNALNHLGRSVEALRTYDRALKVDPTFAMALGNRGIARFALAGVLFDPGHRALAAAFAHEDLEKLSSPDITWDGPVHDVALAAFVECRAQIERVIDVAKVRSSIDLDRGAKKQSARGRMYRAWALRNQLFINPLNALCASPIAAADVLTLPTHTVAAADPPEYIAWFNQMVQEFVAARALCFEAIHQRGLHYADRFVTLVDTLDGPVFSIASEKLRLSFRSAFSLLDKIAGFLNAYLEIGIKPSNVTVRNIWQEKSKLRSTFADRHNWNLRGLYWLCSDLADDHDAAIGSELEPDAVALRGLRHALEHRCLVLRVRQSDRSMGCVETVSIEEFQSRTLSLLRLVRAALIHLSLAVHEEERRRERPPSELVGSIPLPTYMRYPF